MTSTQTYRPPNLDVYIKIGVDSEFEVKIAQFLCLDRDLFWKIVLHNMICLIRPFSFGFFSRSRGFHVSRLNWICLAFLSGHLLVSGVLGLIRRSGKASAQFPLTLVQMKPLKANRNRCASHTGKCIAAENIVQETSTVIFLVVSDVYLFIPGFIW